jgi:hypothetical protein
MCALPSCPLRSEPRILDFLHSELRSAAAVLLSGASAETGNSSASDSKSSETLIPSALAASVAESVYHLWRVFPTFCPPIPPVERG